MMRRGLGQVVLLEVIVGLSILLGVVLIIASLYPTSYHVSLQAARLSAATHLAREVLERQKSSLPVDAAATAALGNQTVSTPMEVQGRPVQCDFSYRLDGTGGSPTLWQITVQWEHQQKIREVVLAGPGRLE
jgi:type II secretory pathway pseudopilin PulG